MVVFLNGKFVTEAKAQVSVFDRSFLYGDGLFETLRVVRGQPIAWRQHVRRLTAGAKFLRISIPFSATALYAFANELIKRNKLPDSLLRITLSRGVGLRGYSPNGANEPSMVMSLNPAPPINPESPPGWRLHVATPRLPADDRLSHYKTCNKLAQILARAEADAARADEALLCNTRGFVVEGASSNLFWIKNNQLCTPPITSGVLTGVTRELILQLAAKLDLRTLETTIRPNALRGVDGVFLSLSSIGVAEGISVNGKPLKRSPLTRKIHGAYWQLLNS